MVSAQIQQPSILNCCTEIPVRMPLCCHVCLAATFIIWNALDVSGAQYHVCH